MCCLLYDLNFELPSIFQVYWIKNLHNFDHYLTGNAYALACNIYHFVCYYYHNSFIKCSNFNFKNN